MAPSRFLPNSCAHFSEMRSRPGASREASPTSTHTGIQIHDDVRVVRPLLWAHKWELQQLLTQSGHRWIEDATNKDPSYARNFIRQLPGIAPSTAEVNASASIGTNASTAEPPPPRQRSSMAPVADEIAENNVLSLNVVADLLAVQQACAEATVLAQEEAGEVLAACVLPLRNEPEGCAIDLEVLRAAQAPTQRRVLSTILQVRTLQAKLTAAGLQCVWTCFIGSMSTWIQDCGVIHFLHAVSNVPCVWFTGCVRILNASSTRVCGASHQ